jgi:hypothetical protein
MIEKEGFFAIPAEYQKYNNDTLGRSNEVGESPVVKYSAQGRDGA